MKSIRVYGKPIPKAKAKHQPKPSKEWCGRIIATIVETEGSMKIKKFDGNVKVYAFFYIKPKGKVDLDEVGGTYHNIKPDLDNLIKNVLDAMKGIYFNDDSQVCSITASKRYAAKDGYQQEGVIIMIGKAYGGNINA